MNRVVLGFVLTLISAFLFAGSGPVAKSMYTIGWTPASIVLLRLIGAAVVLAIPSLIALRGRWSEVWRHRKMIVAYGLVSMAGVQLLYFIAVESLTVAVALLLEMTAPLMIVLYLWMKTRFRPSTVTFLGMLLAMVGLVFVLDLRSTHLSLTGVLCALGAAVCLAFYFVVSAKDNSEVPPVALTGLGMAVAAVLMGLILLTGAMPAGFVMAPVQFAGFTVSWMLPMSLIILFTAGAYLFGIWGLRMVGATVGSFINLTEVPFSVFAAWIILFEMPTNIQLFGGVFIMGGVVFIKLGEARQQRRLARRVVLERSEFPAAEAGSPAHTVAPEADLARA